MVLASRRTRRMDYLTPTCRARAGPLTSAAAALLCDLRQVPLPLWPSLIPLPPKGRFIYTLFSSNKPRAWCPWRQRLRSVSVTMGGLRACSSSRCAVEAYTPWLENFYIVTVMPKRLSLWARPCSEHFIPWKCIFSSPMKEVL